MYQVINSLTDRVLITFTIRSHAEMFINHCDPQQRFMFISYHC